MMCGFKGTFSNRTMFILSESYVNFMKNPFSWNRPEYIPFSHFCEYPGPLLKNTLCFLIRAGIFTKEWIGDTCLIFNNQIGSQDKLILKTHYRLFNFGWISFSQQKCLLLANRVSTPLTLQFLIRTHSIEFWYMPKNDHTMLGAHRLFLEIQISRYPIL